MCKGQIQVLQLQEQAHPLLRLELELMWYTITANNWMFPTHLTAICLAVKKLNAERRKRFRNNNERRYYVFMMKRNKRKGCGLKSFQRYLLLALKSTILQRPTLMAWRRSQQSLTKNLKT